MHIYRRRLPHWDAIGKPVFVTFRLHGSLPPNRVFPAAQMRSGAGFVAMDRLLDQSRVGPRFLSEPIVADLVTEEMRKIANVDLHAFVVMPNHVHVLATSSLPMRQWLGKLKGATAYRANGLLGRRGLAFWQDESFDHWIRNEHEFRKVADYIENNPVAAGLVAEPRQYRWSSAWLG